MDSCFTCDDYNKCPFQAEYGNQIGCREWKPEENLDNKSIYNYTNKKDKLINNLVYIIQRLEREKADLTVNDILTVWSAKTLLGYSHPVSIEEGTGCMVEFE